MGLLDGKVALITGAARGMGRAHATTMAREGADIVAVDIAENVESAPYPLGSSDDLAETVSLVEKMDRRAIAVQADVRSQAQMDSAVERAIAELGGVDIVVANAGIWALTPAWEITEQQWDDVVGINLTGVWRTVRAVLPHMRERGAGSIVITSSINGLEPAMLNAHYTASKHGLIGLMKNVALEMAPFNVRCNAICPGAVDTQLNDFQGALDLFAGHPGGTAEDRIRGGASYSALSSTGLLDPQVVADAALWLVSPGAKSVTGVALPVEGGHLILPGYSG
jgi:SDR family mycofactocin-dependent oxidoreductase